MSQKTLLRAATPVIESLESRRLLSGVYFDPLFTIDLAGPADGRTSGETRQGIGWLATAGADTQQYGVYERGFTARGARAANLWRTDFVELDAGGKLDIQLGSLGPVTGDDSVTVAVVADTGVTLASRTFAGALNRATDVTLDGFGGERVRVQVTANTTADDAQYIWRDVRLSDVIEASDQPNVRIVGTTLIGTEGDDFISVWYGPDFDSDSDADVTHVSGSGINHVGLITLFDLRGGNDVLRALVSSPEDRAPSAVVLGGEGDDEILVEGDGWIRVEGGSGNDHLTTNWAAPAFGDDGNDTLVGGGYTPEVTYLDGGAGDDHFSYYGSNFYGSSVEIDAGAGNDVIEGNGWDKLDVRGGSGDDLIIEDRRSSLRFDGGEGVDTIDYRGVGDADGPENVIVSLDGVRNDGNTNADLADNIVEVDVVLGGTLVGPDTPIDGVIDVLGTFGDDVVEAVVGFEDGRTWTDVTRNGEYLGRFVGTYGIVADLGGGNDRFTLRGEEDDGEPGGMLHGDIVVAGGSGNDTIEVETTGYARGVTLAGGTGNDVVDESVRQTAGDALIHGGGGNDTLTMRSRGTAAGSSGNDTITAGRPFGEPARGQTLIGGAGNDTLDGEYEAARAGKGNDVIIVRNYVRPTEPLLGQQGDDTFVIEGDLAIGTYSGGVGSDTIDFRDHHHSGPPTITLDGLTNDTRTGLANVLPDFEDVVGAEVVAGDTLYQVTFSDTPAGATAGTVEAATGLSAGMWDTFLGDPGDVGVAGVERGGFELGDTRRPASWYTAPLDIAGRGPVDVVARVSSSVPFGSDGAMFPPSLFLGVRIDGGPVQQIERLTGGIGSGYAIETVTLRGVVGSTVQFEFVADVPDGSYSLESFSVKWST